MLYIVTCLTGKTSDNALNVCFYYHDIFKYEDYKQDTGVQIPINFSSILSAYDTLHDMAENLTIDQIIRYTPTVSQTLIVCALRKATNSSIVSYFENEVCSEHIAISKFVSNFLVCYRFLFPLTSYAMAPISISSDIYEPLLIQSITFDGTLFKHVSYFVACFNDRNETPVRELTSTTHASRGWRYDESSHGENWFGIRSYQSITHNLAPPYTTMCKKYSYTDCLTTCTEKKINSTFKRSSPMSLYEHGDGKLITGKFLDTDDSYRAIYLDIIDRCEQACPWNQCRRSAFISSIDEAMAWDTFQINTLLQVTASIIVDNGPKMYFIDYMTFISSCFGTWLGISFLGLNPFKFRTGTVSPSHPESVRMSPASKRLFHLMFQGMKQQQEWIEELDRKVVTVCLSYPQVPIDISESW